MAGKRAIIMGAGLGGLGAAVRLKAEGHEPIVIERESSVGGTWYKNRYPGCACDVQVALYQFSFAMSADWTRLYPQQPELLGYARFLVEENGLEGNIHLGDGAAKAVWNEDSQTWTVTTESGKRYEGDILIAALGQLDRPSWPKIEGQGSFDGPEVHSADWDPDLDWAGKRIGVIGSAASAVQMIPEFAKDAAEVVVFQRSANWVVPRGDRVIPESERKLMATNPEVAGQVGAVNRQMQYDVADHFFWRVFEWTPEGREAYTEQALTHLEAQVPDAELREKLTPDYPVGCRRILITDDFYPALMQNNVDLETKGIAKIDAKGVVMADGSRHDLDIIAYATGFETTGWKWSVEVEGRDGRKLQKEWAEVPEAHLGITVAGFPNMFVLYGPNTNLGHNSITFMLERQIDHVLAALAALEEADKHALEPKPEVQAAYNKDLQEKLASTVWSDPACNSWYKTADGRVTQNWGDHTRAYAAATKDVDLADYRVS